MMYTSKILAKSKDKFWRDNFSRLFFASAFSRALAILAPGTRIYGHKPRLIFLI